MRNIIRIFSWFFLASAIPWACSKGLNIPSVPIIFTPTPPASATQTPALSQTITPTFSTTAQTSTPTSALPGTPTSTTTPTRTATLGPTQTYTPTNTGTINTPTFTLTSTNTFTPQWTATPIVCSNTTTLGSLNSTALVFGGGHSLRMTRYNLFWQSNVTQISCHAANIYATPATLIFVIYDDAGGDPQNLVLTSAPVIIPASSGSATYSCTPNQSLPPGDYWVGLWFDTAFMSDMATFMDQTIGSGKFLDFQNITAIPSAAPVHNAMNGDWKGDYSLSLTWDVCHLPVVTPTPTDTPTITPTYTPTFTPTGTLTPPMITPTPTPT